MNRQKFTKMTYKNITLAIFSVACFSVASITLYNLYQNLDIKAADEKPALFNNTLPKNNSKIIETESSQNSSFALPMDNAMDRITKKYFARYIEKGNSPVENDRFHGYHVGTDFEVTQDELDIETPVYAICDGQLLFKQFAKGYGGMIAQRCELNHDPVTVVYGHLDLETIKIQSGEFIQKGQTIAMLGDDHSKETDGVRKHLHLGVRKGTEFDIRGYVQDKNEIDNWIDPVKYMD